jgi:hypothetical protein
MPWKLIERFEPCLGKTLACFVDGINQSESLGSVCFGSFHLHECARGNEVPTNLGVGRSYLLTVRLMIFSPLQFASFGRAPGSLTAAERCNPTPFRLWKFPTSSES